MTIDRHLSADFDVLAPDGSEVRLLAVSGKGSMAHFTLQPRQVSQAVAHHTVEEIWFILEGHGQMWRSTDGQESVTELSAGLSLTIDIGTHFQFRNLGDKPLRAVAVTIPPWLGMDEAFSVVGKW
jgi:mannose-6-phosphate isomerase-like protein (cupin superfamily)